jgi:hypothetical protein
LSACPIASLLTHLGYATGIASKVPIAVDGECVQIVNSRLVLPYIDSRLFIGSARFETRLKQGVATILGGDFDTKLEFHHVQGAGYVGGQST